VTARLLGLRILTLHATVALVPADVRVAARPAPVRAAGRAPLPAWDARERPGPAGHRLADAVRTLDEGAEVLAAVQRDGAAPAAQRRRARARS
jgi:hypothetical protein